MNKPCSPQPLKTATLPVEELQPYKTNARTHSKAQIRQIADSIEAFGFNNPVLIDQSKTILAGHGRVLAAKLLGMTEVPTVQLEHMNDAQKKAYILADNRLAEKAGWDKELLTTELETLMLLEPEFSLETTGFEQAEIDLMLHDATAQDPDEGDEIPELPAQPVSKLGDVWIAGDHRILCGDALQQSSYEALLGGKKAQMVFTDPPYNVPIDGHVSGKGEVKHTEFAMASGEMTEAQFTTFLTDVCKLMAAYSIDGSLHFVCMDWRHLYELQNAGRAAYDELKNLCVWSKDNGGMGSLYRSRHELVLVFKSGEKPHINNVKLGKHGRYRTNVWNYRGVNTLRSGRDDELAMHPTVKPVAMVVDALRDCSHRGGIVLDPFGGSGTTLIAAEKTQRKARLIEMEPKYIDVTILRWQKLTGQDAVDAATGQTFAERAEEVRHGKD